MTGDEREKRKRAILDKYARKKPNGRPMCCTVGAGERAHAEIMGYRVRHEGKVIFDAKVDADRAANELHQLGFGRQQSYQCNRSRHGHQHLRTVNVDRGVTRDG